MRAIPFGQLRSDIADPEVDALLYPAAAFDHPQDVVRDPDLTIAEKRAILSSWASDACSVESQPALRRHPTSTRPVEFDDIVDALRGLDARPLPKWKRIIRRRKTGDDNPNGGLALT